MHSVGLFYAVIGLFSTSSEPVILPDSYVPLFFGGVMSRQG